jgi:hypothetical protein
VQRGLRLAPHLIQITFAAWQGIVAPVELGMRADDLDATANKQRDKEEIKEVSQSDP